MGRQKKTRKGKAPIKLRRKQLADGRLSLFLDCFRGGKHEYEFLKLYLLEETTAAAKRENARTMRKAESILDERIRDFYNSKVEVSEDKGVSLCDWVHTCIERRLRRGATGANMDCASKTYSLFRPGALLTDIDKQFCIDYINWLRYDYLTPTGKQLSQKTAYTYSSILRTVLNEAVKEGLIEKSPWNQLNTVDKVKDPESRREYLTIDEVKKLIDTDCRSIVVKRAFLFACFSGLRISDIRKLQWKDVDTRSEQWSVSVVMQKTQEPVVIPLSMQARKWMGNACAPDALVFCSLPTDECISSVLKDWVKTADINKYVTFHTSRHTCATMLLTLGADLYTVSKILGHTSIRYTQIYAKIVDAKKDDAVNLVNEIF